MRGLVNKGVLITGGSRGIGKATAQRFLEEGSRVFVCGRDPNAVKATVQGLEPLGSIQGQPCDVAQEKSVAHLVENAIHALGGIDILINNAGIAWQEPFLAISLDHWDRTLDTNLRGMFLVAQAVARHMVARGQGGAIINMSSTNGLVGEEQYAHYNASKGGILLLTKTMAVEMGRYGIRVNALCPGYIVTPLADSLHSPDFQAAYVRDHIPLGRVGRPEDVAAAYAFLASDDAAFINGEGLVIDGGQLAM
jgi:3-oxoacyl-[acyl-carrier protein] reductase